MLLWSTIAAAAADLSGRVAAGNKPLAGAVVTANLIGPKKVASVTVTRTDSRGQYTFRGLADGTYILLVDLNGRRVYQGKITLSGGTSAKNIDL